MKLSDLVSEDAQLEELEDLQHQLYNLLVERHGANVAAGVLGRALAGMLQPAGSPPAAPAEAEPILNGSPIPIPIPAMAELKAGASSLYRSQSFKSDISDRSHASDTSDTSGHSNHSRHRWHRAVAHVLAHTTDPWASRGLHKLPMEVVVRHRYTAATRQWVRDNVLVKVEGRPFAAGAMRECYAMKKLSTFSSSVYRDWKRAPNFVAKRYKKPVERGVYFADVVLQMDAKYLGDEYSKVPGVPKKVDFMQAAVIEFKDRPGKPVLAVEHLIEGDYVKYNSNSGYVATSPLPPASPGSIATSSSKSSLSEQQQQQQQQGQQPGQLMSSSSNVSQEQALRNTPQAFSHFTFEFTKGSALCVDIQGVGDLYTDPQIHTLDGQGYGDGNLALRGMALFMRTHECNILCTKLGLKPFQRCAPDIAAQGYTSSSSTAHSGTMFRSFGRHASVTSRLLAQRKQEQQLQPFRSLEQLMAQLECVPARPAADALVHWEVARLYAETVTLPELRPAEDPDDARAGGLFHLTTAAAKGMPLAQLVLACGHLGLQPSSTQLSHLLSDAKASGEFQQHPLLALRYTQLAAERGIVAAAAALAYAYATGEGVGHGVLQGPAPPQAVFWLRRALAGSCSAAEEDVFSQTPDALNPRGPGSLKPSVSFKPSPSPQARSLKHSHTGIAPDCDAGVGPCIGADGVTVGSMFTLADQLSTAADAALTAARGVFDAAAEEEAQLLPGGCRARYELLADLGEMLLKGSAGAASPRQAGAADAAAVVDGEEQSLLQLAPDPAAAAEAFNQAAEEASAAFKGKLSQRYFEKAAEAEAAAECEEEQ